jgi:hypothetical protein
LKKLAFLGGAAGLGVLALLAVQHQSHAADHLDSPTLATSPLADINDVYAWMDGSNLNLALTVSPADDGTRAFGPTVQYVFHVHSKAQLGVGIPGIGTETRVICELQSDTNGQCWVVDVAGSTTKDHVTGNPSATAGITSSSGKVKLFAGRRSDPFFFNLQGFRRAIELVRLRFGSTPTVTFDAAGCPSNLTNNQVLGFTAALGAQVPGQPPCSPTSRDCFADLNVKVILVQLDKALVNTGSNFSVGVWASTHTKP